MNDVENRVAREPQHTHTNAMPGIHKGIVVDNRDPFLLGRARVHCYGIHGDYPGLNIKAIPWAEFKGGTRGQFSPPELWDRVLIEFEAGDRLVPMIVGYWSAIPMGRGSLPHNRVVGSEIRPENWHQHDLTPETLMLGCSGEGNAIWYEDKLLNGEDLSSGITIEDTGGKYFQTRSWHIGAGDFASNSSVPPDLYGADVQERKPIRDGVTPVEDPVTGSVSFGHQNLNQFMYTDSEGYTIDQKTQTDTDGNPSIDSVWAGGITARSRQGKASISMGSNVISLHSPIAVMAMNFYQCPRRWDK